MQAIDLCDSLTIEDYSRDFLTCSDPELPCDESNLVMKALKQFRQHYEFPPVHIHLDKRIPMQAGLGGGSSNAATVLWALNEKIQSRASLQELSSIGAFLGSDVPFFFSLGSAYCTGRGEIVEPFSCLPMTGYLVKPAFGLATPLVYRETRISELLPINPHQARDRFKSSDPIFFNDLEPAAFRIKPELLQLKQQLLLHFPLVSMSGSGTAFFCMGADGNRARVPLLAFRTLMRDPGCWYNP